NARPGPPVLSPKAQSVPPASAAGSHILHLVSRGSNVGSWREFPAENWITITTDEWGKMLAPGEGKPGAVWTLDPQLTRKLLTNFYPQTEDTDSTDRNKMAHHLLRLTVISTDGKLATARIDGELMMQRTFYPGRSDFQTIRASLIGYLS